MKNNAKFSICLVAMIFILGTLLMPGVAFAQQGQGQQSVKITVTDGVTGKTAEDITTSILSSSGAVIQNLGTVPQGGTDVSLPAGQYSVIVQMRIFDFPWTLASYSFDTSQVTVLELTVSAIFIPIQYLSLLIYVVVFIIILSILISIIRRLLQSKKPVAAVGTTVARRASALELRHFNQVERALCPTIENRQQATSTNSLTT